MTAQVANTSLAGTAARIAQAYGVASSRSQVDGAFGAHAAPGRGQASPFELHDPRDPGARPRRGEFKDSVIRFSGVLFSLDVGTAMVQAQALSGLRHPAPAEAERQVASYEYVQSLFGPAEPMIVDSPFPA